MSKGDLPSQAVKALVCVGVVFVLIYLISGSCLQFLVFPLVVWVIVIVAAGMSRGGGRR